MRVPRRHEMQVALVLRRVRRVALALRRRRQGDSESDAIHLVAVTASRCDGGGEKQRTKAHQKRRFRFDYTHVAQHSTRGQPI